MEYIHDWIYRHKVINISSDIGGKYRGLCCSVLLPRSTVLSPGPTDQYMYFGLDQPE